MIFTECKFTQNYSFLSISVKKKRAKFIIFAQFIIDAQLD